MLIMGVAGLTWMISIHPDRCFRHVSAEETKGHTRKLNIRHTTPHLPACGATMALFPSLQLTVQQPDNWLFILTLIF
jgi:hypothetical protein